MQDNDKIFLIFSLVALSLFCGCISYITYLNHTEKMAEYKLLSSDAITSPLNNTKKINDNL